jgi:hypothetical protein
MQSPWSALSGAGGGQAPAPQPTQITNVIPQPAPGVSASAYPTFPNAAGVGSQKGYETSNPTIAPEAAPAAMPSNSGVVPDVTMNPWGALKGMGDPELL